MTKKRDTRDHPERPGGGADPVADGVARDEGAEGMGLPLPPGTDPADEDLSAFLDGELSPGREAGLRRRLAEEPALAARLAELGEVTGQLRNLAGPASPADPAAELENERVDRMQAALRVRLSVAEAEQARPDSSEQAPSARVISLRPGWNWLVPAAAALAASLALYWGAGNFSPENTGALEGPAPESLASPELVAESQAAEEPEVEFVQVPPSAEERPEVPARAGEALAAVDLAAADDEELAIAFEYDVLADLDVIENLDLLELLDELDSMERI
jgi:anti-sigma factor RsiW